jgi:GNAT superfamily N-acetyltransferase
MNIRPATKDDVAFLRKMMYEAARWNPDWPREPIEEVLADPMMLRYHHAWGRDGDGGVIAEIDGEPVGAAWYRLFTEREPGFGFVDESTPELTIAVVPGRRGGGLGGQLMEALLEHARDEGHTAISLSAEADHTGLYERHGFETVEQKDGTVTMRKQL